MDHYQAYVHILDARKERPDDPEIERLYWERRQDHLLALGRQAIFNEKELEAIASLEKVLAINADNAEARVLIQRAKTKLAERCSYDGDELIGQGEFDQALQAYQKALDYVPDYESAIKGQELVAASFEKLRYQANDHFAKGSRAWYAEQLELSRYEDGLALDKDPSMQPAGKRLDEATRRIATVRFERAKEVEAKGMFGAALVEYRQIMALAPKLPGISESLKRAEKEVEVQEWLRQASMEMRRGQFKEAEALANKAYDASALQRVEISALMVRIKTRRYEEIYRAARDKEIENRLEDALALYLQVSEAFKQTGFLDVRTRISGLQATIHGAKEAYERGQKLEAAGDLRAALQAYQDALLHYAGYKDLERRCTELRARLPASSAGADTTPQKPAEAKPAPQAGTIKPPAPKEPMDNEATAPGKKEPDR